MFRALKVVVVTQVTQVRLDSRYIYNQPYLCSVFSSKKICHKVKTVFYAISNLNLSILSLTYLTQGELGDSGDQGLTGDHGPKGGSGPQGAHGESGETGPQVGGHILVD